LPPKVISSTRRTLHTAVLVIKPQCREHPPKRKGRLSPAKGFSQSLRAVLTPSSLRSQALRRTHARCCGFRGLTLLSGGRCLKSNDSHGYPSRLLGCCGQALRSAMARLRRAAPLHKTKMPRIRAGRVKEIGVMKGVLLGRSRRISAINQRPSPSQLKAGRVHRNGK
jgi:hypothetical protein